MCLVPRTRALLPAAILGLVISMAGCPDEDTPNTPDTSAGDTTTGDTTTGDTTGDTPDPDATSGCGNVTLEGMCAGTVLSFCAEDNVVVEDCADYVDAGGQQLTCKTVPGVGADCISAVFTEGCGDETSNGRCDNDSLIYCESQQTGKVTTTDCSATSQTCVVAPDGVADCAAAGTSGCGAVPQNGKCEGTVLTYCEADEVLTYDCNTDGNICSFVDDQTGFDCGPPVPTGGGTNSVAATYKFEDRVAEQNEVSQPVPAPVRRALVRLMRSSDNTEVTRGYTNEAGGVTLSFEEPGSCYLLVLAVGDPTKNPFSVMDCLTDGCTTGTYAHKSADFTPSPGGTVPEVLITEASGLGGAFNLFDFMLRADAFVMTNLGKVPPAYKVHWKQGAVPDFCESCYSQKELWITGATDDNDAYDDSVLGHEYGHFIEDVYSKSDSPGGDHDGSPTSPLLAWGEGYGTYVGSAMTSSPLYLDMRPGGMTVLDIRTAGTETYAASLTDPKGMNQLVSEFLVSEVLWKITRGPDGTGGKTDAPVFDVLTNYFPDQAKFADRGVAGVDLVDFLDGWFCREHGDEAYIRSIVNNLAGFPYDYAALAGCK